MIFLFFQQSQLLRHPYQKLFAIRKRLLKNFSKKYGAVRVFKALVWLEQHFLLYSPPHFFLSQIKVKLIEIPCFTSTMLLKLKLQLFGYFLNILFNTWSSFKLYHVFIKALSSPIWFTLKKAFVKMDNLAL